MSAERKVALVTGAGMGIGAAVAERQAADGAAVALFDIDGDAASATASRIVEAGGEAVAIQGDARVPAEAEGAVATAVERFGGLDELANIAGIIRVKTVPNSSPEDWDLVQETNVKSAFLFSKYAIPRMRERGGGAIVNAASVMAFAGQPGSAAYCASKAAIVALTTVMALDHAREGIRVNCIAPGSVRTPLLVNAAIKGTDTEEEAQAELDAWGDVHPIGRLVEPEEVAELVSFLLGDGAAAVTGGCYRVDGGLLSRLAL
jgi:meso-butanediol dehydrogenase / (S,S)-butanediol dehydrogenase / diacetyl reductase